jgi:transposase
MPCPPAVEEFGRLHRRVATRYEKRAANYLAMVHIASIRLWL